MSKASDKATLIILHNLIKVILQELHFEVSQIETAIVIGCELVGHIKDDFICVSASHERVRHAFADLKDLLIRRDELIKFERCVRVDRQVANLTLVHIHIDTLQK